MPQLFAYRDTAGREPFNKWFQDLDAQAAAKVRNALAQLEAGNMPAAISADMAMLGAHLILSEVAKRKAADAIANDEQKKAAQQAYQQALTKISNEAATVHAISSWAKLRRYFFRE